jgi:FkbM family methyltransferase
LDALSRPTRAQSTAAALLRRLAGASGNIDRIVFNEDSRTLNCLVPDDSLWIAVKDNLLLTEYERCGIRLSDCKGTVVDAGAHVGLFSLRAAVYASHVVAIEPHPVTSALLTLNLKSNGLSNVTVIEKALWEKREPLVIIEGCHSAENAVSSGDCSGRRVEALTLDELVQDSDMIDLLKIDVEGAEFGVITSAQPETLAKLKAVVGELHLKNHEDRASEVVETLRSAGFAVDLLPPPVEFWRESVSRVLTNWRKLKGNTRLKLLILAAYSYSGARRRLGRGTEAAGAGLAFLYARRRAEGSDTSPARRADQ